jgi:DNA-binding Lrp family transcriptional regulator
MGTTTQKLKSISTETYVNVRTGEYHEMDVVEIEPRDANFCKLWVTTILAAVDELSSQRLKIVFWLVQEASARGNVIAKTTRELAEEIGTSRTTIIDTLKVLERHDILRRKTGVIFMSPEVVYKGSRRGRLEILTRYNKLEAPGAGANETVEEKVSKLTKRMDLLMRELQKVEEELQGLTQTGAAAE